MHEPGTGTSASESEIQWRPYGLVCQSGEHENASNGTEDVQMKAHHDDRARVYERAFLLSPEKRDQVMELWEVQKYGIDSFSDSDYVCIYGMPPAEWYEREFDCWLAPQSNASATPWESRSGRMFESVIQNVASAMRVIVVDPFAGSCNSLLDFEACEEFKRHRVRSR